MIEVPVLMMHDTKRIIGHLRIDETQLPTGWEWSLAPAGRLQRDWDQCTFELLEVSLVLDFKTSTRHVRAVEGEQFTNDQVISALDQFLRHGEEGFEKCHKGYFSGPGWAARCLRFHVAQLTKD